MGPAEVWVRTGNTSDRQTPSSSRVVCIMEGPGRLVYPSQVRAAKLQHEAAGEISGLLAMLQPDTPSPRKHSRKGKNPKSSYSMFARPTSMDEADERGTIKRPAAPAPKQQVQLLAGAANRSKRDCRPRRFHDDLEEAPAKSRAAVHQEGQQATAPARQAAGQPEQTTDKPDAEMINAHHDTSSDTLQEDMIEDSMGEGPAGAATHPHEPAPMLYDTEDEEAEYTAPSNGKKKPRMRKGNPNKKSVQNMLAALGVHAQRKSDADFNGHCAHCNGTGEPWRHAVKAPYAGKLVCSKCGIWDWRHEDQSLLEKGMSKGKARKKAGRAKQAKTQNTQGSSAELAAAVQPEPAAPTSSNSQKNNKVLVQPSDGSSPDGGPVQMTQALPTSPATDTTKPAHAAHAADTAQHTAAVPMGGQVANAGSARPATNDSAASALHSGTVDAAANAAIRASNSTDAHIGTQGVNNTVALVEEQAMSDASAALLELNMPIATSAQHLTAEGLLGGHGVHTIGDGAHNQVHAMAVMAAPTRMPSAAGAADASLTVADASAAMQTSDSSAADLTAQDLAAVSRAHVTVRQGRKRRADESIQADTDVKKAKHGENGSALHQGPEDSRNETSVWAEPMQLDSIVSHNHNTRRAIRRRAQK